MRLSELMSRMNLDVYPQLALVIFAGVFVLVIGRVMRPRARGELVRAALIPLREDVTHPRARDREDLP